ncbi:Short-chain dehydrogenase/reductase SDR [Penicillium expansum]|nr:Short-chain dehydrogenase/reductase SDR [Penicillium expansum]
MPSSPSHPYYPLDANVVGYEPNQTPVLELLVSAGGHVLFFSLCETDTAHGGSNRYLVLTTWIHIAGTLHCFFEGYFMLHHNHMASAQDLFGQLWKEYALSDSRYMTSDTLVLCMETMTVLLWGPLCFVVAYLTATRHSLRHPIQVIVCMSHLYGDMLYYATSLFDEYVHERPYSRPEPYYFWLYYFLMNFIWIVVPAYYLYHSISTISAALKCQSEKEKTKEKTK